MNKAGSAFLVVGAAAGAVLAYAKLKGIDASAAPEDAQATWWGKVTDKIDELTSFETWVASSQQETDQKVREMTTMIDKNANVRAFLETIARCEGTASQPDPYRVCFGYKHTIKSFEDHPAVTGEWKGEKLSDKLCAAAGFGPGCVSTAAGKYQNTKPTWLALKRRLGLKDFSPASQDAANIELLREIGALEFVQIGNLENALAKARKTWASLPGAGYAQPERSLAWVKSQFVGAGGVLA